MFSALRRLPKSAPMGARFMSGHSIEHAIAETDKWKKISLGARCMTAPPPPHHVAVLSTPLSLLNAFTVRALLP